MRGVRFALQLAFGLPLGPSGTRWLESNIGPLHILDAYAMANLLRCSAVRSATTTSKARAPGHTIKIPAFEIDERVWSASCCNPEFVWVAVRHPSRGNWDSPECRRVE